MGWLVNAVLFISVVGHMDSLFISTKGGKQRLFPFTNRMENIFRTRRNQKPVSHIERTHELFSKEDTYSHKSQINSIDLSFGRLQKSTKRLGSKSNIIKSFQKEFTETQSSKLSDNEDATLIEKLQGTLSGQAIPSVNMFQTEEQDDMIHSASFHDLSRVRRGFCRLLCSICEDMASRRWSLMCGNQCESGGAAYDVCFMIWRNNDAGPARPVDRNVYF